MVTSPPAVRRPGVFFVVAGLAGIALAVTVFVWRTSRTRVEQAAALAYLVALDPATSVRLGWRRVPLENAVRLAAGATFTLPEGVRALHLDATTGLVETLQGPLTRTLPKPPRDPKDDPRVDHLQGSLAAWLATLPAEIPVSSTRPLAIYAPAGVTRVITPTVAWETRPGITYDAALRDPEDGRWPVRIANGVVPPVALSAFSGSLQLRPDRIYELLVRETGAELIAGGTQFLVAANAAEAALPVHPAECLAEAAAALAARPYRTGDAWAVLSRLPPDWAACELAVRLRLKCAMELAAPALYRAARADAEKLLAR